ncbi:NINE protein [Agromyces salentinus]|uniref:DUF2510 domain-containing protein n=1 Tax=Agromyces salentinus TaxID=269421 RepID=A0ABN2MLS5_9MICO|nr:NINE protein [Agromyces salentinus]
MTEVRRAAGWYDDEADAAALRYWDGRAWTPHTTPRQANEAVDAGNGVDAVVASVGDSGATRATGSNADARTGTGAGPLGEPFVQPRRPAAAVTSASIPAFASPPSFTSVPSFAPAPVFQPSPMTGSAPAPQKAAPQEAVARDAVSEDTVSEATSVRPATAAEVESATLRMPFAAPQQITHSAQPSEHTTAPLPPNDGRPAASAGSNGSDAAPGDKSFLLTWLFAMLIGSLGVDRFYLGKIGTAVAKLLTAGGLGVWTLVDLVLVLLGLQRDSEGRALAGFDEHRRIAWIVSGVLVAFGMLAGIGTALAIANLAASLGAVGGLG